MPSTIPEPLCLRRKWGQVILRHTDSPAYRCFLPDLAGFTGFCCTGPSPVREPSRSISTSELVPPRQARRHKRSVVWRRGWDSNPRSRYQDSCSPGTPIRPLSHLSTLNVSEERHLSTRPVERQATGAPGNHCGTCHAFHCVCDESGDSSESHQGEQGGRTEITARTGTDAPGLPLILVRKPGNVWDRLSYTCPRYHIA